jgi:hypothetical protein
MNAPSLELANVFRSLDLDSLEESGIVLSAAQRRVLRDITECRTAARGGHLEQCHQCGHQQIAYNSCRNRHCPKCQAGARAKWLDDRAAEVLPVGYFHVVFTLPEQLGPVALQNKRVLYGLLFRAASETLLEIAADPKHLGARIGFLAVLHTWGQTLQHHPHLHCVVPGGGVSLDGKRWIACRKGFFLPVKVLGRLFRGKLLAFLRQAFEEEKLVCQGQVSSLAQKGRFDQWLAELNRIEWVVYAKPPFGSPEQVLKYLARYTHRVAISNSRLQKLKDGQVTFSYKDYAAGNLTKTMTLETPEFTRRFLQHVLPSGFVRIRHYGFLANRDRKQKLALCRQLLKQSEQAALSPSTQKSLAEEPGSSLDRTGPKRCPVCQQETLVIVERIPTCRQASGGLTGRAVMHNTS